MPSPIRLAFVAALAAFALGACSGGGGTPTTGGMTPTPSTPTPGDRTDFFPIASEHPEQVTRTIGESPLTFAGTTLSSLLSTPIYVSRNFPQFSEFQFGAAADANGIPLQKSPAKIEADRHAAIAYQAVLEHSMFIFQGGVYSFALDTLVPEVSGRPSGAYFSTGVPTTGSPIAGTWNGKAVGFEVSYAERPPTFAINAGQAESRIVQGDVEIGVSLDGTDQNVTWAFTDWTGGSIDYPDFTSAGQSVRKIGGQGDHYLIYSDSPFSNPQAALEDLAESTRTVDIQFYGPGRQEAGGTFFFRREMSRTLDYAIQGAFAAKKQAE